MYILTCDNDNLERKKLLHALLIHLSTDLIFSESNLLEHMHLISIYVCVPGLGLGTGLLGGGRLDMTITGKN